MKDLEKFIAAQRRWSKRTFGDGPRLLGIVKHIRSELREVLKNPKDVGEWIDIAFLALDGAWRSGASPRKIVEAMLKKQVKNFLRTYPKPVSQDEPSFHIKKSKS